jgi:SAM-dependent methyltransferase
MNCACSGHSGKNWFPARRRSLLSKLQRSLQKRGVGGTVRAAAGYALEPLAFLQPSRVAKRLYDLRYHVDTSSGVDLERLRIDASSIASGRRYQPSTESRFHAMMSLLPVRHADFVFLDFGSGKGKTLLMAADYPFAEIVGVEFSAELVEIAGRNLRTYRSARRRCTNVRSVVCDAAAYELPAGPAVYYFYNPFGPDILERVAENIRRSLVSVPRPVFIVYYNPVHREVFDTAAWLRLWKASDDFCIYVPHQP